MPVDGGRFNLFTYEGQTGNVTAIPLPGSWRVETWDSSAQSETSADFNGDGKSDLSVRRGRLAGQCNLFIYRREMGHLGDPVARSWRVEVVMPQP